MEDYVSGWPVAIAGMGLVVVFLLLAFIIAIYVLGALSIMELAKKNNIPNPWLAWIPCANYYLLGKLGFEVYPPKEKKMEALTWVTLGVAIAKVFFSGVIGTMCSIALTVFVAIAFYNIFKEERPDKVVLYTVLVAIFGLLALGIIVLSNKKNLKGSSNYSSTNNTNEVKSEVSSKDENVKFCPSCGSKLKKDTKFCPNCGNSVE